MVGYARNGTPAFRRRTRCAERYESNHRRDTIFFTLCFQRHPPQAIESGFFPVFDVRTFYPLYFLPLFFSGILVVYFIRESCHHPHPTIALGKNLTGGDDRVA